MPVQSQLKEATPCVHHFVIATPAGPTSAGTCKTCGMTRYDFYNADRSDRGFKEESAKGKRLKFNGKGAGL